MTFCCYNQMNRSISSNFLMNSHLNIISTIWEICIKRCQVYLWKKATVLYLFSSVEEWLKILGDIKLSGMLCFLFNECFTGQFCLLVYVANLQHFSSIFSCYCDEVRTLLKTDPSKIEWFLWLQNEIKYRMTRKRDSLSFYFSLSLFLFLFLLVDFSFIFSFPIFKDSNFFYINPSLILLVSSFLFLF